ncbi:zinc finger MYM-type protein 1-like [Dendrobium catenatum]|uniref:zinc finger MYM-type protein 1-like n=1 Tax=Dendrobium catenatum TaxID=906689 RepID=UPI0009F3B7F9|nr:zinc finger MYM-type protein 1-like [Dendrobium catenatum]
MAIVVRFVNEKGQVVERFLGIIHVPDTMAKSLKKSIEELLSTYGLSISKLPGQGYDGASNMRGEFNGLKALFLTENKAAHYIHCFSHQLQLALVYVAKNHVQIALLFSVISNMMNIVGVSCKRRDQLRDKQRERTLMELQNGELVTGQGLNQEITLKRAVVVEDGISSEQKGEAFALLGTMQSFEFSFCLLLMKDILGITAELSQALQRKEQDIVNAMSLVQICKKRLQVMRDYKWEEFITKLTSFCEQHKIDIPDMNDRWVARGRPRRRA